LSRFTEDAAMTAAAEIDLNDVDRFNDGVPHEWFTLLRCEDPVYWQEEANGPGFWNITKYGDLVSASRQPNLFSSWLGATNSFDLTPEDLEQSRILMLNMDPPKHPKFRRLVSRGFTPKRIAMLADHIRALAKQIVDDVAERGECDFVDDVAARLPMETICEMIGVPESDRRHIYDLSNKLIGFDDPDFSNNRTEGPNAAAEMYLYAEGLAQERRKCPMDDLATVLLHGEIDGERLTSAEFDSFFLLLALAGNETTRTVTAQGMRLLIEHPEQRRRILDDMSLLPSAVEEMLRYNPAVIHFRRTASADTELRGKKIRKGDKVLMWYPSANRDEEVFEDGQRFDIGRTPNEHLAFGIGEHYCLGANLARLQLNTIFTELLTRVPDLEFAGPPKRLRSNFIDGIKEMPVRFTPESERLRRMS
jgi:cholest-4-en-3-one 26-monooxygenase